MVLNKDPRIIASAALMVNETTTGNLNHPMYSGAVGSTILYATKNPERPNQLSARLLRCFEVERTHQRSGPSYKDFVFTNALRTGLITKEQADNIHRLKQEMEKRIGASEYWDFKEADYDFDAAIRHNNFAQGDKAVLLYMKREGVAFAELLKCIDKTIMISPIRLVVVYGGHRKWTSDLPYIQAGSTVQTIGGLLDVAAKNKEVADVMSRLRSCIESIAVESSRLRQLPLLKPASWYRQESIVDF